MYMYTNQITCAFKTAAGCDNNKTQWLHFSAGVEFDVVRLKLNQKGRNMYS